MAGDLARGLAPRDAAGVAGFIRAGLVAREAVAAAGRVRPGLGPTPDLGATLCWGCEPIVFRVELAADPAAVDPTVDLESAPPIGLTARREATAPPPCVAAPKPGTVLLSLGANRLLTVGPACDPEEDVAPMCVVGAATERGCGVLDPMPV